MKEICVYYSLNQHVANDIKTFECPLVEISSVKTLPKSKIMQYITLGYKSTFNKKIAIQYPETNFDEFEHIIIYAPVWAGNLAIPMNEFLKTINFKNKKFTLIASCSANSGKTLENFKKLIDDSNEVIDFLEVTTKNV